MENKRNKLLINPLFQKSFIKQTLISALSSLVIVYFCNQYFIKHFIAEGLAAGLSPNHIYFSLITNQETILNRIFLVCGILVTIFTVFWGLYMSNRIAGPLLRLQTYLKQKKTDPTTPPLKFRKKDYFQDLAEAINDHLKP